MPEYRVCWTASSNITFRGNKDWEPWTDEEAGPDDIEKALTSGSRISDGLELALEASGFEWWVEVR
jgi:hypothetical protein